MPLASDPNARTRFTLKTDSDKPEAQRATFELRYRSSRVTTEYMALVKKYDAERDHAARRGHAIEAIKLYVIDWQNVRREDGTPLPFNVDDIGEGLVDEEIEEVLTQIITAVKIGAMERRGFTLPSPGNGSASAPPAATASAAN